MKESSTYNLTNNWLPFKTLHAVFFGVFLVRIFPHSDWIQTRKSLNTEIFHAVIFSDNTNVFYTNSHIKTLFNEINIALKNLSEWLKTNKLSVNLSRPNPGRREKIKLNFYFHTSLWYLKRFYEGLKGLRKTFWDTTKKCENKNLTQFSFQYSFQKWADL